jgi:hypothetical protein
MLLKTDFNTHIYPELIEAIEREDETKLTTAIKSAIIQAKGYLSRFDLQVLFGAQGEDRDAWLLMLLKDLAAWNFIVIANPNLSIDFHELRFDKAIKELEKLQAGKIVPVGWPPAGSPEGADTFFHVRSNPKRDTNY